MEDFIPKYSSFKHHYYHYECMPASERNKLKFANGASPTQEVARLSEEQHQTTQLLQSRNQLRVRLGHLRRAFATHLNKDAYLVFHNKTLDALNVAMMAVSGIGPKKYQSFGGPFLQVIQQYQLQQVAAAVDINPRAAARPQRSAAARAVALEINDTHGDEEEEVTVLEETKTMEEIVNEKFEHAAKHGYIISID